MERLDDSEQLTTRNNLVKETTLKWQQKQFK